MQSSWRIPENRIQFNRSISREANKLMFSEHRDCFLTFCTLQAELAWAMVYKTGEAAEKKCYARGEELV